MFLNTFLDLDCYPDHYQNYNRLLLVIRPTPSKKLIKFADNFLSYPADRQTKAET